MKRLLFGLLALIASMTPVFADTPRAPYYDRVAVFSATTGTGTVTLGAAYNGLSFTFAGAGVPNGSTVRYVIVDSGVGSEIGHGVYTSSGTTLTRILDRSTTGSLLSLDGQEVIYLTPSSDDLNSMPSNVFVGTFGGTANAYTFAAPTPPGFTLTNGYKVSGTIPSGQTNTGASTLTVNGTTAEPVETNTSGGLVALVGGELQNGLHYDFQFDTTCTCYVETNSAFSQVAVNATTANVTPAQWASGILLQVQQAGQTFTLNASSGMSPNGIAYIQTFANSTTLALASGTDKITLGATTGAAGTSATIPAASTAIVTTDNAGNFLVSVGGGAGSGTITPSPQYDWGYFTASGTASTIGGVAIAANSIPKSTATGPAASAMSDNGTNITGAEAINTTGVALTDASSITVSAAASNYDTLTLTASGHTMANPTGGIAGQSLVFGITAGANTMLWGTAYKDPAGNQFAPTLATSGVTPIGCVFTTGGASPALTCYGPKNSANVQNAVVAAPSAPNSTSLFTMQGLAGAFTPTTSGNVSITITGNIVTTNTAAGDGVLFQVSHGTGSAPTTNAALTGTQDCGGTTNPFEDVIPATVTAADYIKPFSETCAVNGLTVGTTYWADLAAKAVVATGDGFTNVSVTVTETR